MTTQNVTLNTNEALNHFGINYDVNKAPVLAVVDGKMEKVPNVNAMVRSDTNEVLPGVSVSDSYEVVQTHQYTDIIEKVTGELSAEFVKGGTLKDGKLTYLQCKLPGTIRVKGTDDIVNKYLTFINSFDGSSRFMILPTLTRIFCENQMSALSKEARAHGLRFTHSRSIKERLKMADQAILDAMNAYRAFEVKINWLADTKLTQAQVELATYRLFGVKDDEKMEDVPTRTRNNIEKLTSLRDTGMGMHGWENTAWGWLNQSTEFSDHHRTLRKTTDRFENKLIGSGAHFKEKALNVIEGVIAMG